MPRRRRSSTRYSGQRDTFDGPYIASAAAAGPERFDKKWLARFREAAGVRYVDLTNVEDRRRYHPDNPLPGGPAPRGLQTRPRILVVPEGHSLAKYSTYGGRYSLSQALRQDNRKRLSTVHGGYVWERARSLAFDGRYTVVSDGYVRRAPVPKYVGFANPWQVVICVRRKRRREALFALRRAGKGSKSKVRHRNYYSEVRC